MLARFSDDVLALHPQVLLILAGTNDISGNTGVMSQETTEQNLSSMAELARAHGIRVVLSSLLPVRDTDGTKATSSERPPARIDGLNRWMAAYARLNGFVYLDYHAALVDNSGQLGAGFTTDGVHPTAPGYAVMAKLAQVAIAQSLRMPVGAPKATVAVPRDQAPLAEPALTTGLHAPADGRGRFPGSVKACVSMPSAEDRCACLAWGLENFGDLSRYADANRTLPPSVAPNRRVVFIGDSITEGWTGAQAKGLFDAKPYVFRGISGQTTDQILLRFRQDVIALNPAAVVIAAGINDLAANTGKRTVDQIKDTLSRMADLARLHRVRPILASVMPVSDGTLGFDGLPRLRTGSLPPGQIYALNAWMADYARHTKAVYLDYASVVGDASGQMRAELTSDGVHPNAAGYRVMAAAAEKAIAASFK